MPGPGVDASSVRAGFHPAFAAADPSRFGEAERGSRLLAARLLERNLIRVGGLGAALDRRLAPLLERLRLRRLYRRLGYVRLGDYLTERLGMSLRRCQAILRLERILQALPRLASALEKGEVSFSRIEAVAGVATAETEGLWLERSRRSTVAGLREAIRLARASTDGGADAVAPVGETEVAGGASGAAVEATGAAVDVTGAAGGASASAGESIEGDEPGRMVSFAAPASVVGVWHWTLDLVRRVAGQQEPAWRCAEYLAAEFLSGVPDAAGNASQASCDSPAAAIKAAGLEAHESFAAGTSATKEIPAPIVSHVVSLAPPLSAAGASGAAAAEPGDAWAWTEACEAVRQALASIGPAAGLDAIASAMSSDVGEGEPDAWSLDALLRRMVRLRQSLAWRQGRLLATFASLRLYRDLGFASFDDWCADRLPMSPRRARYLIGLQRRLLGLPLLSDAYRRGLVTWCQARLLVRVAAPATEGRWVRYARQVTVRRLEDSVIACEVRGADSSGGDGAGAPAHIGASPLPPPVPGPGDFGCRRVLPPLLHTSAPPPAGRATRPAPEGRRASSRIAFWAPLDVATLWDSALRACRGAFGMELADWECFLRFVGALRETWENPADPRWRRRYRIFERDGWRCMVPGCTSRSGLNEHHIVFRSQQGGDDDENLVTLCVGHHQEGLHARQLRCFGRAPDALFWDLGLRPGGEPLVRYFGDTLVRGRSRATLAAPPAARPAAPAARPVAAPAAGVG